MRIRCAHLRPLLLGLTLIVLVCRHTLAAGPIPEGKVAELELDPAKTAIAFSLSGWPHETHGTFKLKRGLIRVYPATGRMDGIIIVDASSGNSGETLRDARMSSSILEAPRFPEISFVPQQVESHGDLRAQFPVKVRGLLSLHGVQHDFMVDALISRSGNTTMIHSSFVIPYVKWGLEDPSILMFKVSKEVRVDLTTDARLIWTVSAGK